MSAVIDLRTCLERRGYGISKAMIETTLPSLRQTLTVKPINIMEEFLANSKNPPPDSSFPVYVETDDTIFVPKAYGLKHYGAPSRVDLPDGADIHIDFRGELRPSQEGPANAFLDAAKDTSKMGGLVNLACAGGKTVIALYIISKLAKKTIIVCHKEFLITQWQERIAQFLPTARVGIIKAKQCDVENKDIVIASIQSISMKEYHPSTFQDFALSVYDECHHTSAAVFSRVFRIACTRYTLGLSATLERKDGLTRVFKWQIGDVVHDTSTIKCVTKGEVHVVVMPYYNASPTYSQTHTIFGGQKPNISRMINNICEFEPRIDFVVDCVTKILQDEKGRKVLLLSDRRGHLEELRSKLASANVEAGLYYGGLKPDVLRESEKKSVLLGTYAYVSEGFDNKELNTIILASPKSDIVQVVGRILRTPIEERHFKPLVVDIVDKFSMFPSQAKARLRYYRSQGYSISSVNTNESMQPLAKLMNAVVESTKPTTSATKACLFVDD